MLICKEGKHHPYYSTGSLCPKESLLMMIMMDSSFESLMEPFFLLLFSKQKLSALACTFHAPINYTHKRAQDLLSQE